MIEFLPLFMFLLLFVFVLLGYPVCFTLAGVSFLFAGIGAGLDVFYLSDLGFLPTRIYGIFQNYTLAAVPLFIFLGLTLSE